MTEPIILARALHIAATALASGTIAFMVLVAEPAFGRTRHSTALAALRRRCRVMCWWALAAAIVSGAAWLALLAADLYGASVLAVCLHGGVWDVLTGTRFGAVWTARLAIALALVPLLLFAATRWLQLAGAGALIALLALIGHAGAAPGPAGQLHLVSDLIHLLAAGLWLGALPGLALLLAAPRPPKGLAARAVARFSVLGIVSVAALLLTGLINSWNLLSGPRDLIATPYGRLLLLKLGLFAAILAIAAVNHFHLTPRLARAGAARSLMRNSLAETALGLGIVVLVGALGTMPPAAHKHLPPADIPPDAAFVHIHSSEAMADVTIEPGETGSTNVSIRVLNDDMSEFPCRGIRIALTPLAGGGSTIEHIAMRQASGTWLVNRVDLAQPGIWTVQVFITTSSGEKILLDAPIVIEPTR